MFSIWQTTSHASSSSSRPPNHNSHYQLKIPSWPHNHSSSESVQNVWQIARGAGVLRKNKLPGPPPFTRTTITMERSPHVRCERGKTNDRGMERAQGRKFWFRTQFRLWSTVKNRTMRRAELCAYTFE